MIAVEFAGNALSQENALPLSPVVTAVGAGADKIKIKNVTVQPMPDARFRVAFQLTPAEKEGKLADAGPIELRCCLKRGENFLTETWVHRVTP
jgi:periplasmic glucans biosynthesis protein